MHPDETPTDAALVRRLLARQFPEWADASIEPVPDGGTDTALYRVGGELVARLPRHERTAGTLERERHWLPWLAPQLPLAIPEQIAEGRPGEGYPWRWSLYRWLEGVPAMAESITDATLFARDLAKLVRAFREIDPTGGPPPGPENAFRGAPLAGRDDAVRTAIATLGNAIDGDEATEAWEEALAAPEWHGSPVWIHGDLDRRNLLVVDGRLSAVVDFGCIGVGDPACDVAVAWKAITRETRDVFRSVLDVDDATWSRARGWTLSQALMVEPYYTLETNAALVLEGRRWLADVLARE
jgi:aminoglycoside phosphotransferase (APT) family kinase protein